MCIAKPEPYAERKRRREAEIEGLKQAPPPSGLSRFRNVFVRPELQDSRSSVVECTKRRPLGLSDPGNFRAFQSFRISSFGVHGHASISSSAVDDPLYHSDVSFIRSRTDPSRKSSSLP